MWWDQLLFNCNRKVGFFCAQSLKLYKKCLALNFSKWHDTLHPFRAFDILKWFCLMDDLPWWAMDSGDLMRKIKLSPFAKHSTSKFTCGESLHYSTSSFFLQCFFVPISLLIYVFFLNFVAQNVFNASQGVRDLDFFSWTSKALPPKVS